MTCVDLWGKLEYMSKMGFQSRSRMNIAHTAVSFLDREKCFLSNLRVSEP